VRVTRYRNGKPIPDIPSLETRTSSGSTTEVTTILDEEAMTPDELLPHADDGNNLLLDPSTSTTIEQDRIDDSRNLHPDPIETTAQHVSYLKPSH